MTSGLKELGLFSLGERELASMGWGTSSSSHYTGEFVKKMESNPLQ